MERPSAPDADATTPEARFTALRPLLFSVAYRLLGRPADAEDVVQESWLRYARAPEDVRDPRSWLIQVVTRLCLDQLRSAHERHELAAGVWLPEPVLTGESVAEDPLEAVERRELLSMGALAMLQQLSPAERAALVLHEAIGLSHGEVAEVIDVSEAASRQLLSRARRHVAADPARQPAPPAATHRRLLDALRAAFDTGDTGGLVGMLRDDAVLVHDTGGELPSPTRPLVGPERILHFLARVAALRPYTTAHVEVNGEPGLLFHAGGEPAYLVTCMADEEGRLRVALDVGGPTKFAYARRQRIRLPS